MRTLSLYRVHIGHKSINCGTPAAEMRSMCKSPSASPARNARVRAGTGSEFPLFVIWVVLLEPLLSSAFDFEPPFRVNQLLPIALLLAGIALRMRQLPAALSKEWPLAGLTLLSTGSYLLYAGHCFPQVQSAARTLVTAFSELFLVTALIRVQNQYVIDLIRRRLPTMLSCISGLLFFLVVEQVIVGRSFDALTVRVGFGRDHPATLGYLSALLAFANLHFSDKKHGASQAIISRFGFAAMLVTLFLAQTRGASVAFLLTAIASLALQKRWLTLTLTSAAIITAVTMLGFDNRSAHETRDLRLDDWNTFRDIGSGRLGFWPFFLAEARSVSPILGGGFGHSYQFSASRSELLDAFGRPTYVDVHNDFLMIYIDTGCIGVFLFVCAFFRYLLRRPIKNAFLIGGVSAIALVCSCIDNFVNMTEVPLLVIVLLNLGCGPKPRVKLENQVVSYIVPNSRFLSQPEIHA